MTETPLKPCPFCGEKEELYPGYRDLGRSGPFWIDCLGCGMEFRPLDGVNAIAAWNQRDLQSIDHRQAMTTESKVDDGGTAYPMPFSTDAHDVPCNSTVAQYGMSLRDYFAGQALAGIMAQSHTGPTEWTHLGWGWGEDTLNHLNKGEKHVAATVADFAYAIADAMLAARKGGSNAE